MRLGAEVLAEATRVERPTAGVSPARRMLARALWQGSGPGGLGVRPGLRRSVTPDPLLRWLAWDGFGFHQGFFHADRVVGGRVLERGLTADQRAIRDQGLGRSLWFHECADPEGIVLRVNEFARDRRADLWAGV